MHGIQKREPQSGSHMDSSRASFGYCQSAAGMTVLDSDFKRLYIFLFGLSCSKPMEDKNFEPQKAFVHRKCPSWFKNLKYTKIERFYDPDYHQ